MHSPGTDEPRHAGPRTWVDAATGRRVAAGYPPGVEPTRAYLDELDRVFDGTSARLVENWPLDEHGIRRPPHDPH